MHGRRVQPARVRRGDPAGTRPRTSLPLRRGGHRRMNMPIDALPDIELVRAAARRIAPHARVTPVMRCSALDALRGACNAVWSLDDAGAARGVVTHSSGNHGNALALAAATRGIAAHVVVPEGAVRAKLAA